MIQSPDIRIGTVAAQQHGVVTVEQALKLGLSRNSIYSRVRRGEYQRLERGVLLVTPGDLPNPWHTRVQAALLRHGPSAVAGLGTAAQLLGMAGHDTDLDVIQLILPRGVERAQTPGIRLHFRDVPESAVICQGSIRCTDPVATLADLVPQLGRNRGVAVLDSALNRRLLTLDELAEAKALTAHRPGRPRLLRGGRWQTHAQTYPLRAGLDSTATTTGWPRTNCSGQFVTVTDAFSVWGI